MGIALESRHCIPSVDSFKFSPEFFLAHSRLNAWSRVESSLTFMTLKSILDPHITDPHIINAIKVFVSFLFPYLLTYCAIFFVYKILEKKVTTKKFFFAGIVGVCLSSTYAFPEILSDLPYFRAIATGLISAVVVFGIAHKEVAIGNILYGLVASGVAPDMKNTIEEELKKLNPQETEERR
jgi:hypothetical protein